MFFYTFIHIIPKIRPAGVERCERNYFMVSINSNSNTDIFFAIINGKNVRHVRNTSLYPILDKERTRGGLHFCNNFRAVFGYEYGMFKMSGNGSVLRFY